MARLTASAWLDMPLALAVAAAALLVRLPHLLDVPVFTDEIFEVGRGLAIARGGALRLTNVDPYIGGWNNYLTAAAMLVFGEQMEVARGVSLALGVVTVLAVYWLAREVGLGRIGASLAAALLATSAVHAIGASRIAWSNCTTSFYTTVAAAMLIRSVRRDDPRWLVGMGLFAGLALQTHPTALPPLLGLAAFAVWRYRSRGRPGFRWSAFSALAFLIAYSPVLVYNLHSGFESVSYGLQIRDAYQAGRTLTAATYLQNLRALLVGLLQLGAGSLQLPDEAVRDPATLVGGLLWIAGLVWSIRRGWQLLPLSLSTTTLILPAFSAKFGPIIEGRYLMPLLPLLVVAESGMLLDVIPGASAAWTPSALRTGARAARAGGALLGLALLAWALSVPLLRLSAYQDIASSPPFNAALEDLGSDLAQERRAGEVILLDRRLRTNRPEGFQLDPSRAAILALVLDLDGAPTCVTQARPAGIRRTLRDQGIEGALFVTTVGDRELENDYSTLPNVGGSPLAPALRVKVYRIPTPSIEDAAADRNATKVKLEDCGTAYTAR